MRELSVRVRELEERLAEMEARYRKVEEENKEFADRYIEIEEQNNNLANLYVASYQLHSTLDYKEVVRIVQEIVINLIGAEAFHLFMVSEKTRTLELEGSEGQDGAPASIPVGEGMIGKAAKTGENYFAERVAWQEPTPFDQPIAVIPLKIKDSVIGVISINKLLVQKTRLHDHGPRAVHAARRPRRHRDLLRQALLHLREEAHHPAGLPRHAEDAAQVAAGSPSGCSRRPYLDVDASSQARGRACNRSRSRSAPPYVPIMAAEVASDPAPDAR